MRNRGPRAWAARWRASLRIARRDAWRNKRRSAVVVAMIALPALAAVLGVSVVLSSFGTLLSQLEGEIGPTAQAIVTDVGCGGCEYFQTPDRRAGGSVGDSGDVPPTREAVAEVLNRPLAEVVAVFEGSLPVETDERVIGLQFVRGMAAEAIGQVYAVQDGELPSRDGEVAVAPNVATRLGLALGETLTVDGVDLTVVGVLDTSHRPVASVLTTPDSLDLTASGTWFVLGADPVEWDDVVALNGIGVSVGSRAVVVDPPEPDDVPFYTEFGPDAGASAVSVGSLGLIAAVAAIALIETVLLIGPAFAVGARRQTRQLALISAAGGSGRDVRRVVLATGVVAGTVAGVVGAGLGVLGVAGIYLVGRLGRSTLPAFIVPWWLPVAAVLGSAGLGALAAWMPSRAAARRDTVAALGGRRADATPPRRTPWIGVVLGAVGLVVAAVGGVIRNATLLVGGIVALEIGVILAVGGVLVLMGRLAPRLSLAGRFALRDALRQRSRTVPAVASVVAAVAAAVAAGVYVATDGSVMAAAWQPSFGAGTMVVRVPEAVQGGTLVAQPDEWPELVEEATARISAVVPVAGSAIASVLTMPGATDYVRPSAQAVARPDQQCPFTEIATPQEYAAIEADPRCGGVISQSLFWVSGSDGTLVDNGTVTRLLGWGEEGDLAAEALADGKIVVGREALVWPDGSAHVEVYLPDPDDPETEGRTIELIAPAHLQEFSAYLTILPTSVVEQTAGLTTMPGAAVFATSEPFDTAWADAVRGDLRAGYLDIAEPYRSSTGVVVLTLTGIATLVALGATWLSVGLAAGETRPDLATMSAVGAGPGVRRRIAAAQAAVIALLGVALGVGLGLLLGWVLGQWSMANAENYGVLNPSAGLPGIRVPWLAIGVMAVVPPVLAIGGAWLTAPRHLPLVRRLAQ